MSDELKNDTIQANLEGIVKSMSEEAKTTATEPTANAADKGTDVAAEPKAEAFAADDALIERAVKAGLSVADAKSFANGEVADRILTALEAKASPKEEKADATTKPGDAENPVDDFVEMLNKVENDKDDDGEPNYSPEFVRMFKALGARFDAMKKEIAELRGAGETARKQTAFDKAFDGLDEGVREHVDAASKSQLKKKFDFLKAAHDSAQDGASDEEVFNEAKSIVLGDVVSRAQADSELAALAKRKSLALARPGGESGQRGTDKPMTEEDIANALFAALTK